MWLLHKSESQVADSQLGTRLTAGSQTLCKHYRMDACAHLNKVLLLACMCLVLAALCNLHVRHKEMFKWMTEKQMGMKDGGHRCRIREC